WKNRFVLCLDLFEDVSLDCTAQLRNNSRTESAFRGRNVHRHNTRRRAADGHRGRKIRRSEIEAIIKPHHVLDGVDSHSALTDFSEDTIRVAIDAIKSRPIERSAEPVGALVPGQIME